MRKRKNNQSISVQAICGSHVVRLGLDAQPAAARGLLGFNIVRTGPGQAQPIALTGGRDFAGVTSDVPVIQSFLWGDYGVEPAATYIYRIVPVSGTPARQKKGRAIQVTVTTEDRASQTHAVVFNRGVAGSQA